MPGDDWGPPFDVKPQEITFDAAGVTISATLYERPRRPLPPVEAGKKAPKTKEGDPEAPPRAWCILVHGLMSDRNEFGALPMVLAKEGLGVVALDVPGHGKSGGPRGVYDLAANVGAVRAAMNWLQRAQQWDLNPQQWAVIGHSMGGVSALKASHLLHAGDVIVACTVPRTLKEESSLVRRLGYALLYGLAGRGNGSAPGRTVKYPVSYKDIFVDKAAMEAAKAKGFLQSRIPLRNYPLMNVDAEEIARQVGSPTVLVVTAAKDRVVDKRRTRRVYEALATAKQWIEIPGSGHSLFLDAARDEAIKTVVEWVRYRLQDFNEARPGHTKR